MAYYLDLYNGSPSAGGTSILAAVTGSATRDEVTTDLVNYRGQLTNPAAIVVTTASLGTVNVSHAALFSAASGGTLVYSAPIGGLGASPYVVDGRGVQFRPLALGFSDYVPVTVSLSASLDADFALAADLTVAVSAGQWDFSLAAQSGQILTCGI